MGQEQGKVLNGSGGEDGGGDIKADIAKMDAEMSRRMGRGVDWNLKVLIRGERATGKTCLFERLQGNSFSDEYSPTPRISVAHIHWSYKTFNDIVKVEVWDVVDVARQQKKTTESLKISADVPAEIQSAALELDANTVDVMRGTHAVIMCYDPRKRWTWEYIERELPKIAALNVHVLVLEAFRDIVVPVDTASAQDPNRRQASMKNCYGLKSVKTFLNFPFLAVQKQSYEAKLKRNQEETTQAREEFRVVSEEQTYDSYLTFLAHRTKAVPTTPEAPSSPSPAASPSLRTGSAAISAPSSPQVSPAQSGTPNRTASAPIQPKPKTEPEPRPKTAAEAEKEASAAAAALVDQIRKEQGQPPKKEEKKGFFSSLLSKISKDEEPEVKSSPTQKKAAKPSEDAVSAIKQLGKGNSKSGVASVDDFKPEADDDDWLSGPDISLTTVSSKKSHDDDDDDDSSANPMVASDVDDIVVDYNIPASRSRNTPASRNPVSPVVSAAAPVAPPQTEASAAEVPSSLSNLLTKTTPMSIPSKTPKEAPHAPPPSAASYSPVISPSTSSTASPPASVPQSTISDSPQSRSPDSSNLFGASPQSTSDSSLLDMGAGLDSFLDDVEDPLPVAATVRSDTPDSDGENDQTVEQAEPASKITSTTRRPRGSNRAAPATKPAPVASLGKKKLPAQDSETLKAIAASLAADWDSAISSMPAPGSSPKTEQAPESPAQAETKPASEPKTSSRASSDSARRSSSSSRRDSSSSSSRRSQKPKSEAPAVVAGDADFEDWLSDSQKAGSPPPKPAAAPTNAYESF